MRNLLDSFRCSAHIIVVMMLSSLGTSNVMAQEERSEYVPFVEEGKVWYCGYWHPNGSFPKTPEDPFGEGIDCIFTMCGDTQISGKDYKKVYCQYKEYYGDEEQHYYCAVREEDYRVFIVEDGATEEKLLYDFSQPGELITLAYNDFKFARTCGEWYNHYFLPGQLVYSACKFSGDEVDYSHDSIYWIDGVGSPTNNPFAFEFRFLPFGEPKLGKDMSLRTCMKDGKYFFHIDWMVQPSEPASIDSRKHIDNSQKESHLYDLQGRRLTGKPIKGLYIQNGKKFVVK